MSHATRPLRIVFAGTPEAAVPSLDALVASGADVVGVVTRPDAPLGRKRVLTPSPVARAAAALGLPVVKAARLDEGATQQILALEPDLGVIVAYGGLVKEPLLSAPAHGWINLHFSLLPKWRGAAPVQRALIAGDEVTGAAVFQLVQALDAGDVFDELTYRPGPDETAGDVLAVLAESGAGLLADVVERIGEGSAVARPQVGEASLAPKLALADGLLDLTLPADAVLARFRGVTPEPGAHTTLGGERFKIHTATRGEGDIAPGAVAPVAGGVLIGTATNPLFVDRVQPAGKPAMRADAWYRGLRGDVELGS